MDQIYYCGKCLPLELAKAPPCGSYPCMNCYQAFAIVAETHYQGHTVWLELTALIFITSLLTITLSNWEIHLIIILGIFFESFHPIQIGNATSTQGVQRVARHITLQYKAVTNPFTPFLLFCHLGNLYAQVTSKLSGKYQYSSYLKK